MKVADEYTIDELARAAGSTVRSVRVYHERGLLPPPDVRGRTGYYGTDHIDRLQTIQRLLSRGMKLNGIRELLDAWDRGDGLAQLLGVAAPPAEPATAPDPNPRCGDLAARLVELGAGEAEAHAVIDELRTECDALARHHAAALFRHPAPAGADVDLTRVIATRAVAELVDRALAEYGGTATTGTER
ncbi:MerR family transcriptional regulator [Nocardia stercoris]|uniref:MerR family transcriptional regulator n=1 Tax=Nocardia stercoris TaxID=2483361 RepID=A0A3M2L6T3_9NOCA|nr:MerR family transcriptional regulator [Nocardia stercoris]